MAFFFSSPLLLLGTVLLLPVLITSLQSQTRKPCDLANRQRRKAMETPTPFGSAPPLNIPILVAFL